MSKSQRLLLERRVTLADAIKVEPPWEPVLEFAGERAELVRDGKRVIALHWMDQRPWADRGDWIVRDRDGGQAFAMTEEALFEVYEDLHLMVREEQE
jgi:hypothetical protein